MTQVLEKVLNTKMKHLGLFEGVGGFSLAGRWMGWETVAWCEWNEFGQKVLKYYFPEAKGFGDITKTDFKKYANRIDIVTGGFPCQPYSAAGKRKGKEDQRHLWPEMLRAIREIQPSYVVGENVRGLTNWNGGMVFDEVQADLEAEGFEVLPFLLPACAVNAPHRRDRIWFIAYNNTNAKSRGNRGLRIEDEKTGSQKSCESSGGVYRIYNASNSSGERCNNWCNNWQKRCIQGNKRITEKDKSKRNGWKCRSCEISSIVTKTRLLGQEECKEQTTGIKQRDKGNDTNTDGIRQRRESDGLGKSGQFNETRTPNDWENFPTQSPICGGDDGLPTKLDGITFSKWRNESLKAYGNAIVPQVALQIFRAIELYDKQINNKNNTE